MTPDYGFTDLGYTGQRNYASFGLMDYRARFYSPTLGRFTQPDTVIPSLTNTQSWNRFSYVNNSPVNFNDPTGHIAEGECGFAYGGCGSPSMKGYHPRRGGGTGHGGRNQGRQPGNIDEQLSCVEPKKIEPKLTCDAPSPSGNEFDYDVAGTLVTTGEVYEMLYHNTMVNITTKGHQYIIYGTRNSRTAQGMNPYTNRINIENGKNLYSYQDGVYNSIYSWSTVVNLGLMTGQNLNNDQFDNYDRSAALLMDTGAILSTTTLAAYGGIAAKGALMGTPFGPVGNLVGGVTAVVIAIVIWNQYDKKLREPLIDGVSDTLRPGP
jgi:RHS repeat-associated protein